jgi:hypothetical protein
MEVVLLVVAVIGIALLVVPRVQRKRKPRARRSMPSVKAARRRAAVAASAAPAPVAVSTWTPSSGSAPSASDDDDGWDDDLGWEGEANPEPETREAWQRWRATESPLASAAEPVEASNELPSVERWRAAASTDEGDWLDDDGLGWEGEESRSTPRVWVPEQPVVTTATAPEVATRVETGREWATNGNGHVVAAPAPAAAPRKRRFHPVLLVALYAAVGIGAIVLVSTVLFGNSSSPSTPQPASNQTPKAAPTTEPELTGTLADETSDGEFKLDVEPDDSATAAARKARRDFQRERSRALAAERRDVAAKAAAERRKAAAERRKQQQQQQQQQTRQPSGGGNGGGTGGGGAPPQGGGGGGGNPAPVTRPRPTCEFCIG